MKTANATVESPRKGRPRPIWWIVIAVHTIAWGSAAGFAYLISWHELGVTIGLLGLTCLVSMAALERWAERRRWLRPIHDISEQVIGLTEDLNREMNEPDNPELIELFRAVKEMQGKLLALRESEAARTDVDTPFATSGEIEAFNPMMTRSGAFDPPEGFYPDNGDAESAEMINRLDPKTLYWIDSSPAEQEFLGWTLSQLKEKSFLEIIDPEDRVLAKTQLLAAIGKGEGHNLLYRIRTARQEVKAIELHLAVRYGRDEFDSQPRAIYVKIRSSDMTKKVRAERELRRRTKELIDVNGQLRRINRELESLKNRYSDLYQNAPALYLNLDARGIVVECNDTMLNTLGRSRDEIVGQPYISFLIEARKPMFDAWFEVLKTTGYVELESRWVKANGEVIDVWFASTAVRAADGTFRYSRSVGRDVTTRRVLEAELRDKNERLARANIELSRKNKELDEFAYIVAHDLKEPLRTIIAFSDFLEVDCGDRIGDAGQETLNHIVAAARRMRSLISDLQTLGRAGKVAGEFARVRLETLIERIRADYAELLRSRHATIEVIGELPELWGDPTTIGQLIANLVGNGLKYNSNEHPRVEIEALIPPPDETGGTFVTLAVRDNGIGIDPKFHEKIFELFRRLHTRDEFDGTGAGLAICQKIVEAHGGRIWVESEPECGSIFLMTLPLAAGIPSYLEQSN